MYSRWEFGLTALLYEAAMHFRYLSVYQTLRRLSVY